MCRDNLSPPTAAGSSTERIAVIISAYDTKGGKGGIHTDPVEDVFLPSPSMTEVTILNKVGARALNPCLLCLNAFLSVTESPEPRKFWIVWLCLQDRIMLPPNFM